MSFLLAFILRRAEWETTDSLPVVEGTCPEELTPPRLRSEDEDEAGAGVGTTFSSTSSVNDQQRRGENGTNLNPAVEDVLGLVAIMMGYPALQYGRWTTSRELIDDSRREGEVELNRTTYKSISNAEISIARQPKFMSPLQVKIEPWKSKREGK